MSDRLIQSFFNLHNVLLLSLLLWLVFVTLSPQFLLSTTNSTPNNNASIPSSASTAQSNNSSEENDTPPTIITEVIYKVNTTNEELLRQEIERMQAQIHELHQELFRTAQAIPAPKVIEVEKLIPTKDPELEADLDFVINVVNEIAQRQELVVKSFDGLKVALHQHDQQAHQRLLALSTGVTPSSNEDIQERFQEIQDMMEEMKQLKSSQVLQLEEQLSVIQEQAGLMAARLQGVEAMSTEIEQKYHKQEELTNQVHTAVQMVWQAFVHYRETVTETLRVQQRNCQLASSKAQECPVVEELPALDEVEIARIVNELLAPFVKQLEEAKMHRELEADISETVPSQREVPQPVSRSNANIPANDFALFTAGTRVVAEYTSPRYLPEQFRLDEKLKSAAVSVGLPTEAIPNIDGQQLLDGFGFDYGVGSANDAIKPSMEKGQCWGMKGSEGDLVLRLSSPIYITSVSIDHISKRVSDNWSSAPQEFQVFGANVLGEWTYLGEGMFNPADNETVQTFPVLPTEDNGKLHFIKLHIMSNHGNPDFTCLYRFRVHGHI